MTKTEPEHFDILKQPVAVGDIVAVSHHGHLRMASITKLNNKMIKIRPLSVNTVRTYEYNVYSKECVRVEGPAVTVYALSL